MKKNPPSSDIIFVLSLFPPKRHLSYFDIAFHSEAYIRYLLYLEEKSIRGSFSKSVLILFETCNYTFCRGKSSFIFDEKIKIQIVLDRVCK
jgi:hypothetical protein